VSILILYSPFFSSGLLDGDLWSPGGSLTVMYLSFHGTLTMDDRPGISAGFDIGLSFLVGFTSIRPA
jgi:hypothetical protein